MYFRTFCTQSAICFLELVNYSTDAIDHVELERSQISKTTVLEGDRAGSAPGLSV